MGLSSSRNSYALTGRVPSTVDLTISNRSNSENYSRPLNDLRGNGQRNDELEYRRCEQTDEPFAPTKNHMLYMCSILY